jgi:hypothetical protein
VGCHEHRGKTPENKGSTQLAALRRPASRIQAFAGQPDVVDFTRDVQPILDRRCVACHSPQKREGRVNLSGDLGPHWSHSFFSLFAHRLVADGRNGLGNQPPRTIGSSASRLLTLADGTHHGAKATPEEWRTLWLWIESGATYVGSYAALRNQSQQELAYGAASRVYHESMPVLQRRCYTCHKAPSDKQEDMELPFNYEAERKARGKLQRAVGAYERIVFENDPVARLSPNILLNFTRPEFSALLLGPLANPAGGYGSCGEVFKDASDADFKVILGAIRRARDGLDREPRYGTPGFKPNRQYVREMKRYGTLPASFDLAKDPIDVFATDQAYWRSLWHQP